MAKTIRKTDSNTHTQQIDLVRSKTKQQKTKTKNLFAKQWILLYYVFIMYGS